MAMLNRIISPEEFENILRETAGSSERTLTELYGEASATSDLAPYYKIISQYFCHDAPVYHFVGLGMVAMVAMLERHMQRKELEKLI